MHKSARVLVALFALQSSQAFAETEGYLLGPQDHLKIKVYDWRSSTGEAHEWTALIGEFVVNASGNVSFPIVGEIPAANMSTSHLAMELANKLQAEAGLAQVPVASVEVSEYRPFYVIGAVDKPGEYAYRPGLTVLRALSVAGGVQRFSDLSVVGFQRDAVSGRGDLGTLKSERSALQVRLARLQAEIADAATFDYTAVEAGENTQESSSLIQKESLLFENFKHATSSQIAVAKQTKDYLGKEIVSLTAKDATVARQLQLLQSELDSVNSLLAKGLVVSSRQSQLEESQAQFESSRLDIQLAIARAQQDIIRADRDLFESSDKAKALILTEATDVQARLAVLKGKIESTQVLTLQAESNAALSGTQMRTAPQYYISRTDPNGKAITYPVDEGNRVQPGDTVKVERGPAGRSLGALPTNDTLKEARKD